MKFKDKLQIMRKKNNMSQETLSEKMNVTRQSVSKWESGASYPDMEKIMCLTKILNCTLEDLLDDGAIGNTKEVKHTLTDYLNDFLKYITNLYNMILAMNFKQKITCMFEMGMIAIILLTVGVLSLSVFRTIIYGVLNLIPILNMRPVQSLFYELTMVGIKVLALMIWFHLLKIRYLNYYVTIEDQGTKEKVIEKEINEKTILDKKKEVVIIRDPKDKSYSFFNIFSNIIIFVIKLIVALFALFGVMTLVCLLMISVIALAYTSYNSLFFFAGLCLLSISILNVIVLKILVNYIFNIKTNMKQCIATSFILLIAIGINLGFTVVSATKLELIDNKKEVITENLVSKESLNNYLYSNGDTCFYNFTSGGTNKVNFKITDTKMPKLIVNADYKVTINDNGSVYLDNLFKLLLSDLKKDQIRENYYINVNSITIELNKNDYNYIMKNK